MNQDVIVESIGKHMDTVATYVNAIVLLAIGAAWAGIRRSREIEALGAKFDRRHAFWVLAAVYLVANAALLILFLRIGDLVLLLDRDHVVKGTSTLLAHPWVLNPFSYFGDSGLPRFHSCEGYGLLIAVWWLCNTSLSTLMDDKRSVAAALLLVLFVAMGLASMLAIYRAYWAILDGVRLAAPQMSAEILNTSTERFIGTVIGVVVGALAFFAANKLQSRLWRDADPVDEPR